MTEFRTLSFEQMRRFPHARIAAIDIETDTRPLTEEEQARGYGPRGLDPRIGRVVNVGLSLADGVVVFEDEDERELLRKLDEFLSKEVPPLLLSSWNGSCFDAPFLDTRYQAQLLTGGPLLQFNPAYVPKYEATPGYAGGYDYVWPTNGSVDHVGFDVCYHLKQFAQERNVIWSLKPVCEALGIDMVRIDAENAHKYTAAQLAEYVSSDTIGTRLATIKVLEDGIPAVRLAA